MTAFFDAPIAIWRARDYIPVMAYWLIKSEPSVYPWSQMLRDKRTHWNGVRNHQAANYLRAMQLGDWAFFYHSNEGKEIVGLVEIVRAAYPDPSDESGKFVMVDVKAGSSMPQPVGLAQIKSTSELSQLPLIKQSRLSVLPVTPAQWKKICQMGGMK